MRTILLLGGSRQQVVAIEKAKALGYRTVLCDYLPDNPGQYVADAFYLVSTTDREAVLDVAKHEQVEGVLAYASDPAAPTAAFVAEALGLPTNPLRSVEILSQKHLFRKHLREAGLPCPNSASFTVASSAEQVVNLSTGFAYPLVIKPTDSSGSKGVTIIHKSEEIGHAIEYARQYSRNDTLIVEEYIERGFPNVIGGDIFVVDGKIQFWGLMRCLRDDALSLVPVGKCYPSGLTEIQLSKVEDVLQKLVDSLGIRFGEMNVEVLLGQDDTPFVLELGARAGGNMIPIQLSECFSIDLVAANVQCAMGQPVSDMDGNAPNGAYMTYVLHSGTKGLFEGIDYSPEALQAIYREVFYKQPGDSIEHFSGADKALGIVFLRFGSEDEMVQFVDAVDCHIKVKVRS